MPIGCTVPNTIPYMVILLQYILLYTTILLYIPTIYVCTYYTTVPL